MKLKLYLYAKVVSILFIVLVAVACSSNKDKEYFDSASTKYKANDFYGAVSDYNKLLNEYPNSKFAEDSYFAIANIYQMNKVPNLSREKSAKKAVEYFQKYYKQFPDSERAPKALFLIGFILANDLQEYDSARIAYTEFLNKYPQHELAASVKMELDYLGKTPEEIIEQKQTASK
jgi:TolA-binding protein